jgi:hypothetical protein
MIVARLKWIFAMASVLHLSIAGNTWRFTSFELFSG